MSRTAANTLIASNNGKAFFLESESPMRKQIVFQAGTFALMLAGLASFPTFAQQRSDQAARVLKAVDTDNDGTIDLAEVKKAASAI